MWVIVDSNNQRLYYGKMVKEEGEVLYDTVKRLAQQATTYDSQATLYAYKISREFVVGNDYILERR